jgi:23S rRNA (guanosine2251-2'-O)-methyltransferase
VSTPRHIIAGLHPVKEILEQAPLTVEIVYLQKGRQQAEELLDLCRQTGVRYQNLPRTQLAKLAPGQHQGVLARVFAPGFQDPAALLDQVHFSPLPVLLVLDQVQDPGNLGVLARTLYALGGAGLVVSKNNSAPLGTGAFKSSAGALNYLPVGQVTNIARFLGQARDKGLSVIGASSQPKACPLFQAQFDLPLVLVLGNEHKGLRSNTAKGCDQLVRIPLARPFDSLNVAQAGAIILGLCLQGLPAKGA